MKIIINESQLRLIVENEDRDDNLLDFTNYKDIDPDEWDEMFEHLNKKKGGKYDGYYINGDVDLEESNVTQLKYLVKVSGYLNLNNTPIESLPMLKYVDDALILDNTPIKSLPMLSYVGGMLEFSNTPIESLPDGLYVGRYLSINNTPLSKTTTIKELRSKINVAGSIYLGLIYL